MAVNRVEVDGEVKLDLSADSVSPQTMLAGATAHDASGEPIEGAVVVAPIDAAPTEGSENAVASGGVWSALQNVGGGGTERKTGTLTTAGWTAGTGYAYEQTLTLDGVTAETDFDYDCELSSTDVEADATVLESFSLVVWAGSQAGGIRFCATDKPDSNIPVLLRVYR